MSQHDQDRPHSLNFNEPFSRHALELDAAKETERLVVSLRQSVHEKLRRQGAVVGISGGIDSSTVLALCARAFGPERVVGILLPEQDSSPESATLAHIVAEQYGVSTVTEDISAALHGLGCYRRRDEAIARVFPEYAPDWKAKIVLPGSLLDKETLNVFSLTVTRPDGQEFTKRLPLREYYQIVAASNFKQRTRMALLYYHAELRNYAVIGTPNKNERDLGFFVKYGDGGVDVNPIVHLFKSQVYQLARYLGVPEEIQKRTPTSDTYSGGSTQEEFFFRLPFEILDVIWFGYEQGVPGAAIAKALNLSDEQVERVVADIIRKQRTTAYLRTAPLGVDSAA
jgi:NAD+ synthase